MPTFSQQQQSNIPPPSATTSTSLNITTTRRVTIVEPIETISNARSRRGANDELAVLSRSSSTASASSDIPPPIAFKIPFTPTNITPANNSSVSTTSDMSSSSSKLITPRTQNQHHQHQRASAANLPKESKNISAAATRRVADHAIGEHAAKSSSSNIHSGSATMPTNSNSTAGNHAANARRVSHRISNAFQEETSVVAENTVQAVISQQLKRQCQQLAGGASSSSMHDVGSNNHHPAAKTPVVAQELNDYVDKIEKENFNLRLRVVALERLIYSDANDLNSSNCSIDEEVDRMIREINENQSRLHEKEVEIEILERDIEAVRRDSEEKEQHIAVRDAEIERLNHVLRSNRGADQHEVRQLQSQLQEYANANEEMHDALTTLREVEQQLRSEVEKYQVQLETTDAKYGEMQRHQAQEYEKQVDDLTTTVEQLQTIVDKQAKNSSKSNLVSVASSPVQPLKLYAAAAAATQTDQLSMSNVSTTTTIASLREDDENRGNETPPAAAAAAANKASQSTQRTVDASAFGASPWALSSFPLTGGRISDVVSSSSAPGSAARQNDSHHDHALILDAIRNVNTTLNIFCQHLTAAAANNSSSIATTGCGDVAASSNSKASSSKSSTAADATAVTIGLRDEILSTVGAQLTRVRDYVESAIANESANMSIERSPAAVAKAAADNDAVNNANDAGNEHSEVEQQLEESLFRIEQLENDLLVTQSRYKEVNNQLQTKNTELDRVEQENRHALKLAEKFEQQNSEKTSQMQKLRDDFVTLQMSYNKHVQKMTALDRSLKERDSVVSELKATLASARNEKSSLEQRVEGMERTRSNSNSEIRDKLKNCVTAFGELTNRLIDIINFLNRLADSTLLNETIHVSASAAAADMSIDEQQQDAVFAGKVAAESGNMPSATSSAADIQALTDLSCSLQLLVRESFVLIEKQNLEADFTLQLTTLQDALAKLDAENHDLLMQLRAAEAHSKIQHENMNEAEKARDEALKMAHEVVSNYKKFESEHQRITKERDELSHQLEQAKQRNVELENQIEAAAVDERTLDDARNEINHLTHRIIGMERELTGKINELNDLTKTLDQVKQLVRDRDVQNSDLKRELERAHEAVTHQKMHYKKKQEMLKQEIKLKVNDTTAGLSGARERIDQLLASVPLPMPPSNYAAGSSSSGKLSAVYERPLSATALNNAPSPSDDGSSSSALLLPSTDASLMASSRATSTSSMRHLGE